MSEQIVEGASETGGWFGKLIAMLLLLWNAIPEKTKERIFERIVDGFDELFRYFFRKFTQGDVTAEEVK